MAIYNGPARGGTRGGKDLFDWEDVKEDSQAQNYLGHSVKAPVGRWQKNKDLNWYVKKTKIDLISAQKAEKSAVKDRDAELMAQMLGEKPMEMPKSDMTRIEKNKLYKRGNAEEGTVAAEIEHERFGERVEGIGYAPIKIDNLREQMDVTTHERQEGTAMNDLLKAHIEGTSDIPEQNPEEDHDHAALLAALEAAGSYGNGNDGEGIDVHDKKALKKRMKKLKKEEKKRKKDSKKEKKGKRPGSSSDSDAPTKDNREERKTDREDRGDGKRRRDRSEEQRGRDRSEERRRDKSEDRGRRDRSEERGKRERHHDRRGERDNDHDKRSRRE